MEKEMKRRGPPTLGALVVQPPSLINHKDTKAPRMRGMSFLWIAHFLGGWIC